MCNALTEAEALGLDCVQVFTKNQQQWVVPPLDLQMVSEWKRMLVRMGWMGAGDAVSKRVVSHASYLINLASPDESLRAKSLVLMRDELARCMTMGIAFLVFHPGSFTTGERGQGRAWIAEGIARLINETRGAETVFCLENVAGAGATIGASFAELAELRRQITALTGQAERIGVCIDTCHAHAAGYDLATTECAKAALDELDATVGLGAVRALHLNDSKGAAGSHLDRHEHIGKGTIRRAGFEAFVNCAALADVPKVIETPKGVDERGLPWDTLNVRELRAMVAGAAPLPPLETIVVPARLTKSSRVEPKAKADGAAAGKKVAGKEAKPKLRATVKKAVAKKRVTKKRATKTRATKKRATAKRVTKPAARAKGAARKGK